VRRKRYTNATLKSTRNVAAPTAILTIRASGIAPTDFDASGGPGALVTAVDEGEGKDGVFNGLFGPGVVSFRSVSAVGEELRVGLIAG